MYPQRYILRIILSLSIYILEIFFSVFCRLILYPNILSMTILIIFHILSWGKVKFFVVYTSCTKLIIHIYLN